jgi:hypothetical protein
MTAWRTIAYWTGVALLVTVSALGWAALITLTGGLAPVVWCGSGPATGLAAGASSAAIAGLVIWLATRRHTA